jgi:hypothetical protein
MLAIGSGFGLRRRLRRVNLTLAADHAGIDAGAQAPPPKVVGERHIFAAGRRAMEKC